MAVSQPQSISALRMAVCFTECGFASVNKTPEYRNIGTLFVRRSKRRFSFLRCEANSETRSLRLNLPLKTNSYTRIPGPPSIPSPSNAPVNAFATLNHRKPAEVKPEEEIPLKILVCDSMPHTLSSELLQIIITIITIRVLVIKCNWHKTAQV